jgi:hypothetical protein
MSLPAAFVRNNSQFKYGYVAEFDDVVFALAYCSGRTEIPLLPNNLAVRVTAVGRPAQDELLCALGLFFLKNELDAFQPLRLVEHDSDDLRSRFGSAPAPLIPRLQGAFDGMGLIF